MRKRAFEGTKGLLLPWHRITLYMNHWYKAEKLVVAWRPDVIHSCDLEGLVPAARAAAKLDVPHLHDCHELYLERALFHPFEKRILRRIENRMIKKPDIVTVVNQSIGSELSARYDITTLAIRNCADVPAQIERRDLRLEADLPVDARVVLYQGGLQKGRGLEPMIESASLYPENVYLVILGYGPLEVELIELVALRGLEERVRFVAAVPPDQLLGLTASADVGVVPYQPISLNNRLALPNKIFEYLTAGVPVIASDIPELRRIVVDAGCGRTYDPFSPKSLAAAVKTVLVAETLEQVTAAAVAYGKDNSWSRERRLLTGAYERLLGRARVGAGETEPGD